MCLVFVCLWGVCACVCVCVCVFHQQYLLLLALCLLTISKMDLTCSFKNVIGEKLYLYVYISTEQH